MDSRSGWVGRGTRAVRKRARSQRLWVVFALTLPTGAAEAADASKGAVSELLVVLNKSDHEAALVDPRTRAVVAKIPTGRGPHEVAISPDGRTAYVCNYGAFGIFREGGERHDEPGNTISVIDLERRAVRDTFDLGTYTMPHGIWVSRDGTRLWVTCEGAKAVLELDAKTGAIMKHWNTGQDVSHMLVPTRDEKKLYVTNIRSGSVTVVTRAVDSVQTLVTGAGAEGVDLSPDGREVWVTNRGANTISVIETATDRIAASFESGGTMPIRVKLTPDGRQAFVSNARSSSVTVFDAGSRKLLATLDVGAVPVGIQMSPDGKQAFVACTNDNVIKVLDVAGRKVAGDFTTGNEPDGMAWATRGGAAAGKPRR